MMIPRLEKSLCGCSLYTGSLILAWLYTIGSMAGVLLLAVMGPIIINTIEEEANKHGESAEETTILLAKTVFAFVLVILIVGSFINGCLLYGVYKRNHCMMMPHLIFSGFGLCFSALNNLFFLFVAFVSVMHFMQFIVGLIQTAIAGYFWILIFSFYKLIKDEALQNQNTFNKL